MKITTTDYHTRGEPFRNVTSGVPEILSSTMSGNAFLTGEHTFILEADDEMLGFVFR